MSVALGDFNGDGIPDLVVAGNSGVSIWFGNGDGTFQPPVNYDTSVGYPVVVGEFNGDGRTDFVVFFSSRTTTFLDIALADLSIANHSGRVLRQINSQK